MHTVLVTGAAGLSAVIPLNGCWRGAAIWVVGVDTLRTGRLENLAVARASPHFAWVQADAGDETCDARPVRMLPIRWCAAPGSAGQRAGEFREPALNYRLNLANADCIARLCLECGCKRLVFASSAAVYGAAATLPNHELALPQPRQSPYAAAKLAAETMLLGYAASYGLEAVCLRYFNIYGPRQDPASYSGVLSIFTDRFRQGLPVTVYGDGEQNAFVAVQDAGPRQRLGPAGSSDAQWVL